MSKHAGKPFMGALCWQGCLSNISHHFPRHSDASLHPLLAAQGRLVVGRCLRSWRWPFDQDTCGFAQRQTVTVIELSGFGARPRSQSGVWPQKLLSA